MSNNYVAAYQNDKSQLFYTQKIYLKTNLFGCRVCHPMCFHKTKLNKRTDAFGYQLKFFHLCCSN